MFPVLLVCSFMGYIQSNGNLSLYSRIPDIIHNLCPGSNVCHSNRSFTPSDDISFSSRAESCCAECSCSSNCTKTGNCCFPKTIASNMLNVENGSRNLYSCLYPMFPPPSLNLIPYSPFFMVTFVQRDVAVYSPSNVPCGDMKVAPWGSLYPVYSARTKQIYKNIECAKKAGEDSDVIVWDAVIKCKNHERDLAILMIVAVLDVFSFPDSCHVMFFFPGDFEVLRPLKCYTNFIDSCAETIDFAVPEGLDISKDEVRILCKDSGLISPYRYTKMYANVFCHICNAEKFSRTFPCEKYSGLLDEKFGKMGMGEFIAFIDFKFITENRNTNKIKTQDLPIVCSKGVNKCRRIFCPTGQLRDRTRKCVYPNKTWYNQNYAVYINLTLNKLVNITDVFNITQENHISKTLPTLQSTWLSTWKVDSIYYRAMDATFTSNNFVICMRRKMTKVDPNVMITKIKAMIGQAWSIQLHGVTEHFISSNFSTITVFRRNNDANHQVNFHNVTERVKIPNFNQIYVGRRLAHIKYAITKLYICEQVELEPSEFYFSYRMDIIYNYVTKRFMFDGQFSLVQNFVDRKRLARICVEDSGMYKRTHINNLGEWSMLKQNSYMSVFLFLFLIFIYEFYD